MSKILKRALQGLAIAVGVLMFAFALLFLYVIWKLHSGALPGVYIDTEAAWVLGFVAGTLITSLANVTAWVLQSAVTRLVKHVKQRQSLQHSA